MFFYAIRFLAAQSPLDIALANALRLWYNGLKANLAWRNGYETLNSVVCGAVFRHLWHLRFLLDETPGLSV